MDANDERVRRMRDGEIFDAGKGENKIYLCMKRGRLFITVGEETIILQKDGVSELFDIVNAAYAANLLG